MASQAIAGASNLMEYCPENLPAKPDYIFEPAGQAGKRARKITKIEDYIFFGRRFGKMKKV